MKGIFDELTKHLKVQKAEAEVLRQQFTAATTSTIETDERLSAKLESCLEEERQQAAADRQTLISQITGLIQANSAAQEQRFSTRISGIRDEMATARLDLNAAEQKYCSSMDQWSRKEDSLADEVLKSREALKKKLQKDWDTVEKHSTSIEATTKSVHGETVRIVEAQMRDMAVQMQALDDFVTRARNHNDKHQTSQSRLFEKLSSNVTDAYSSTDRSLNTFKDTLKALETDLAAHQSSLTSLPDTLSSVAKPLSDLRETINSAAITEYTTTGATPQKTTYSYPTTLPRTKPHAELLGKVAPTELQENPLLDVPDLLSEAAPFSPSKANIYNDPFAAPSSSTRPATVDGPGLREVSINVAPSSPVRRSDPLVSSVALSKGLPEDRQNKTEDLSKTLALASSLMGPPPLKRVATDTNGVGMGSKLPKGTRRAEGRENAPPVVADFSKSLGSGRRLRSGNRGS